MATACMQAISSAIAVEGLDEPPSGANQTFMRLAETWRLHSKLKSQHKLLHPLQELNAQLIQPNPHQNAALSLNLIIDPLLFRLVRYLSL
jgi:hypothetical protein